MMICLRERIKWERVHFQVKCQVCGVGENLEKTSEVKWKFVIQKDGLCRDRTYVKVRQHHGDEINHTQGGFYTEENLATVKENLQNINNWNKWIDKY